MADIGAIGLETGDTSEFDATNGSPTVTTDEAHCGSYSVACNANNEYVRYDLPSTQSTAYMRFYVKISAVPTCSGDHSRVLLVEEAGGGNLANVQFGYCAGTYLVAVYLSNPGVRWSYAIDWQADTWYEVEFRYEDGGVATIELYIDGNLVIDETANTSAGGSVGRVKLGSIDLNYTATTYIDCFVVSTTGPIDTHDNEFTEEWEDGTFDAWDGQTGTPDFSLLRRHCGDYSNVNDVVADDEEGPYINLGHHKTAYLQFQVQFDALPALGTYIEFCWIGRDSTALMQLRLRNNGGTYEWGFVYRAAGSPNAVYDGDTQTNPSADTWYCVTVYINCTYEDGQAAGDYQMWVGPDGGPREELDDCTQNNVDTDYTGISDIKMLVSTDDTDADVYNDCIKFQTIDLIVCHESTSEDEVQISIAGEVDCDVDATMGEGPYRVWLNCDQIYSPSVSVESEIRGVASIEVPYEMAVSRGDLMHVFAYGERLIQGHVVSIRRQRSGGIRYATVQNKTARLWGKIILSQAHRYYSGEDAGEVVKDLVDYYFNGLFTTNHVNINVGITISDFDCYEQTVGDALEEVATRAGCSFFIDEDNDLHFFIEGSTGGVTIQEADIIDVDVEEVGVAVNRVIVKGVEGISASAGAGVPEKLVSDRRITTEQEAQEVASRYLRHYNEQVFGGIVLNKFYSLRHGQKIIVNSPRDGLLNEELVVYSCRWDFSPGGCQTTINVGLREPSFDFVLREVQRQIEENQINRISGHTGSETTVADPFALYEDIVDTSASNVTIDGAVEDTVVSQAASTNDDAMDCAFIRIRLTRDLGSSIAVRIRVYDGTNTLASWYITVDDDCDEWVLTHTEYSDLSGKTLTVYGQTRNDGDTCQVDCTQFLVRQFSQHAHSHAQTGDHVFD
jgi:hypothetical protein